MTKYGSHSTDRSVTIKDLVRRHEARATAILLRIAAAFRDAGREVHGPFDDVIDHTWTLMARTLDGDEEKTIDVHLELALASDFAGTPIEGIAFGLRAVSWAGKPLIAIQPNAWTRPDDLLGIEENFVLLESITPSVFAQAAIVALKA